MRSLAARVHPCPPVGWRLFEQKEANGSALMIVKGAEEFLE
jgi:hypothetical protein